MSVTRPTKAENETKRKKSRSYWTPVWTDADALIEAVELFFIKCKKEKARPTIQRLAIHLGYSCTKAIWDNRKPDAPFTDIFNDACLRIESGLIDATLDDRTRNLQGKLFVLRSMGVTDTQKIDITSNGEKIENSSMINCQVINPETSDILKLLEQNNGNPKESSDTSIET